MMLDFNLPGFFISDPNNYYLFYIITGVALGIILSGIYSAFWQIQKKKIFKLLVENEAFSSDSALCLNNLSEKDKKAVLKLTKEPTSVLYKFISSDALDSYNVQIANDLSESKHVSRETKYKITENNSLYIKEEMIDRVKRESQIKEVIPNLIVAEIATVFVWFLLMMLLDRIIEAIV